MNLLGPVYHTTPRNTSDQQDYLELFFLAEKQARSEVMETPERSGASAELAVCVWTLTSNKQCMPHQTLQLK